MILLSSKRSTHQLKGVAGSIGANRLYETTDELIQQLRRRGEHLVDCDVQLAETDRQLSEVLEAITQYISRIEGENKNE